MPIKTLLTLGFTQREALDAIGAIVVQFPYDEFFNSWTNCELGMSSGCIVNFLICFYKFFDTKRNVTGGEIKPKIF